VERLVVDYSIWGFATQITVGLVGSQRDRVREGDSVIAIGDGVQERVAKVLSLSDDGATAVIRFLDPLTQASRAS
jgi:hypothetical protein